jgi:flagellar basal body-associated protein FliL
MGQNLDNQDKKSTKPAQSGRDPKAARERRRKREAARRKREKQIRIRMIILGLILLAVIGVGAAALMIHMRNVKEKEAAIEEARRTEAEQAAFEATRQEEPVSPETPAAAAAATTVQKTEEDAAAAAATTGKNAEEEGALAASRKAAQEEKERKESEKIPGLSESYDFKTTDSTADVPEDMDSEFAVLVDLEKGTVIAGRGYQDPIYPASMTKVLTLLVAVENIDQSHDQLVHPTAEITRYAAHQNAKKRFKDNDHKAKRQRDSAAVHQSDKHIHTLFVGAEKVRGGD